jgi:hypothetical protein
LLLGLIHPASETFFLEQIGARKDMVNPSGGAVITTMLIALLVGASVWVLDPAARIMADRASQGSSVSELEAFWGVASMTSSQYSEAEFSRPTGRSFTRIQQNLAGQRGARSDSRQGFRSSPAGGTRQGIEPVAPGAAALR